MLADALTSVLAIVALLAGKYAGWNWMDPAMGIVGAILITRWSWGLLKATSRVLLDQQQTGIQQGVKRAFSYHRLLYVIVGHKTSRNRVILGSKPERPTNDRLLMVWSTGLKKVN